MSFLGTIKLALAYLRERVGFSFLSILIVALSVAMIVVSLLVSEQLEGRLERDAKGIDLVLGAKGSPLQLVLAAVYHLDVPPGNIKLEEAKRVSANPMIKQAIPLAMGDTLRGFRIIGTEPSLITHYSGEFAQGALFTKPMQAVLGAEVAARTGLAIGASFAGNHGLGEDGASHDDIPFSVSGILKPTGTVLDRLVLTPVESVWRVHGSHEDETEATEAKPVDREITAMLIQYQSPLAAAMLPRTINSQSSLLAASPALETGRLMAIVGAAGQAVQWLAGLLAMVALISVFIAINANLASFRYDLATLRLLGAKPRQLAGLLVVQGTVLAAVGAILGIGLGHLLAAGLGAKLSQAKQLSLSGNVWMVEEVFILVAVLLLGALAAAWPAWRAYRTNVVDGLKQTS